MAETLLKKESLSYEDVEKLIGPPPHGKKNLIESVDLLDSNENLGRKDTTKEAV